MSQPIIEVEGLSKRYRLGLFNARSIRDEAEAFFQRFRKGGSSEPAASDFWALKDVSFTVQPGEVLGIIGRNGAGKSTLLKLLSRITEPTSGQARIRGRVASLLEVGTGFHPELTGRENIFLNGAILGMSRTEIRARFDEIVAFAEIDKFLDTPVKRYSSGMYVRLAFAVAAHLDPEILIIDEVLAVGDASFQNKCLKRLSDLSGESNRTVLFVSHNIPSVLKLCTRSMLLSRGSIQQIGATEDVVNTYLSDGSDPNASTSLQNIESREGDGKVTFERVDVLDQNQELAEVVRSGDRITLHIHYRNNTKRKIASLHVSAALFNMHDAPIVHFSSSLSGQDFQNVPASETGRVVIAIDKLQLIPGRYKMTLYSAVNGALADTIRDACVIEVQPGDYYGSGRLPAPGEGCFLAEYEMTHEATQ